MSIRAWLVVKATMWAVFSASRVPFRLRWWCLLAAWYLRFPVRAERESTWAALMAESDRILNDARTKAEAAA